MGERQGYLAMEAVKCLLGVGDLLTDRLLVFDALRMTTRIVPVRRRPDCRCAQPGKNDA